MVTVTQADSGHQVCTGGVFTSWLSQYPPVTAVNVAIKCEITYVTHATFLWAGAALSS